ETVCRLIEPSPPREVMRTALHEICQTAPVACLDGELTANFIKLVPLVDNQPIRELASFVELREGPDRSVHPRRCIGFARGLYLFRNSLHQVQMAARQRFQRTRVFLHSIVNSAMFGLPLHPS